MRQGFRPSLEPPTHRKAVTEARRPVLCLALTLGICLLVFAIFGLSAWNVFAHKFDTNTLQFHTWDELSLREEGGDLSATFCEGYKVNLWGQGHVYLLPKPAVVDTSTTQPNPVEMRQKAYRPFNVKAAYLLKDSSVNVTACFERGSSGPSAKVVFIRGEDNFHKWRGNAQCHDCVLREIGVHEGDKNAFCDTHDEKKWPRLHHKVNSNDRYFLVIFFGRPQLHHQSGPEAEILLKGEFLRTHFDVHEAEQVCEGPVCSFSLPWGSDKDVVIKLEGFQWNSFRNVTSQCQARVVLWVNLFGVLPVVVVLPVAALLAWFLCRRTQRNARAIRKKENRTSMKGRHVHERRQPPPYVAPHDDYGTVAIQAE